MHIYNLRFYRWDTGNFGSCSASCGGGERVRPVKCVQTHGAEVVKVPDSECPPEAAPNAVEKCNMQHCPARYNVHTVLLITGCLGSSNFPRL